MGQNGVVVLGRNEHTFAAAADIAAMVGRSYMDAAQVRFISCNREHIRPACKPVNAAVARIAVCASGTQRLVRDDLSLPRTMAVEASMAAQSLPVVTMLKESISRTYDTTRNERVLFVRGVGH